MFNKIGEDILEAILEFKLEHRELFEKQKKNKAEKLPEILEKTYELIQQQHSLENIASLSKLPEAVISMQIETLLEHLPQLDISTIIKKHEIELIEKEIKKGVDEIKELKENLPSFITYGKIRIVLAKNR
jgi:ATP-dependent DNA helicase RecQ